MRIFYTLCLFLCSAIPVFSQNRLISPAETETRIIKFYPNPAVSQITFSFEKGYDKNYSFQIFNFIGKKVYEVSSISPKQMVDLSDFFRGVYIFQVRDKSGKIIESGKFQVTR